MGIIDKTKGFLKRQLDVKAWVSWEERKRTSRSLFKNINNLFVVQKASKKESFEQAMERLGLDEEALLARKKEFYFLIGLFLSVAVAVMIYACWLFGHGHMRAFVIASGMFVVAMAQTIRYHFWIFQIKQRRLGCSLKEWFLQGFLGINNSGVNDSLGSDASTMAPPSSK